MVSVMRERPGKFFRALGLALATLRPTAVKRWAQAVWLTDQLRGRPGVGIHCHFGLSASTVALSLRELNGNPFTFTAHAKDIFLRSVNRDLLPRKIDASGGVIAVSDFSRRHLLENVSPGRDDKIRCIHNGIDLALFTPAPHEGRDARRLLAVSRLVEKKGLATLIRACGLLRERGVEFHLRICGDGACRQSLEDLVRHLSLGDRVEFLGALPQGRIREELGRCALLIAPSLEASDGNLDALPTALLEALATGTPAVSTAVSGIPEIITDGVEGILVPPNDAAALADAIESLLADDERRRQMSLHARAKAERKFNRDQTASQVARFLAERHAAVPAVRPPLHVGHILTMFPRLSETFVLREIHELESLGVRVTVFSQKPPLDPKVHGEAREIRADVICLSPWWHEFHRALLAHLRLILTRPRRYGRLVRFLLSRRNLPTLKKLWRAGRIAVEAERRGVEHLHCHFMTGNARIAEFVTSLTDLPHSITAHAKDIYASGLSESRIRRRLRDAAFVVTISDRNRRHLLSKEPEARVELIYNSVRPEGFEFAPRAARQESEPLHALAVGRLVPKKGFHVLIEAAAQLRASGFPIEVRIVGEGEERGRLDAVIAGHRLNGAVKLAGPETQEELRGDFAWADVLVIPCVAAANGDIDGIPVVALEAMAQGVPVIASEISGIPEVVIGGKTGLLVEPGDVAELAEALRHARPPALNDLARAARRRLETNHDITVSCQRLLALMQMAMESPRR
jgi:glycosyltransferase involved in cell wall biosynthesis